VEKPPTAGKLGTEIRKPARTVTAFRACPLQPQIVSRAHLPSAIGWSSFELDSMLWSGLESRLRRNWTKKGGCYIDIDT
jgi:hypothetical protein